MTSSDFDFFADHDRSIAAAEVQPGGESRCKIGDDSSSVVEEADSTTHHKISIDSGEIVGIRSGLIIGRRPAAQTAISDPDVLVLEDQEGLISRNHLLIYRGDSGLIARDLGSTNGTVLRRGDQSADLPANRPVNVRSGDRLALGSRTVTIN